MLADDALALIEDQCDGPVHFAGLSMGGMTGQALASKAPQRLRSLIIINSASHYEEAAQAIWQGRMRAVREQGVAAIADGAMQRWFTPAFRADAAGGRQVGLPRLSAAASASAAAGISCSRCAALPLAHSGATHSATFTLPTLWSHSV